MFLRRNTRAYLFYYKVNEDKNEGEKESNESLPYQFLFEPCDFELTAQPAQIIPGTSPEGPLKILTSGIYRGPSGDQCKNWWFNEKYVF